MIGILQNINLKNNKMTDIMIWHYKIVDNLLKKFKVKLKYDRTIEQLEMDLGKVKLEDVIKASPSALKNMVAELPHERLKKYVVKSTGKHIFCHLYDRYRKEYGAELVEQLEIVVCPYCNRSFINSKGDKTPAQFDHFFNKDKYPIFALSLYNLIPCCSTCNSWKHTTDFHISLYDTTYTTDKLLQFSFIPKDIKGDYAIEIKAVESRMNINIDTLQLKERYSTHIDLIQELISRRKMFRSCNLNFWNELAKNNGLPNGMGVDEFVYGNYLSEDKYYLRPLSKFTHDIVEELNRLDNNN